MKSKAKVWECSMHRIVLQVSEHCWNGRAAADALDAMAVGGQSALPVGAEVRGDGRHQSCQPSLRKRKLSWCAGWQWIGWCLGALGCSSVSTDRLGRKRTAFASRWRSGLANRWCNRAVGG